MPHRRRGDGGSHVAATEARGRSMSRGGLSSPRARDPPRREDAEWERRRSRSPPPRTQQHTSASLEKGMPSDDLEGGQAVGGDLGSALLSGVLQEVL